MIIDDNPIEKSEDDDIDRDATAKNFAQNVLKLDTSKGIIVGVLGPWGSGKTSFINLAKEEFKQADVTIIIDFNPWMFSGAAQLVESFFIELTAQLRIRPDLVEVGKELENYGDLFSGFIGGATKVVGRLLQSRRDGVYSQRQKLKRTLSNLDKPIIVMLDDIDRLSPSEIRDIFKLVRLTASFPNIVYIVAFDRDRVEDALAEQGLQGRDYLEKILQVAVDLPVLPSDKLNSQITSVLSQALANIKNLSPVDEQVWPDVFYGDHPATYPEYARCSTVRRYCPWYCQLL